MIFNFSCLCVDADSAQSVLEKSSFSAYGKMKTTGIIKGSSVLFSRKQCNFVEKQISKHSTSNRQFSFITSTFLKYSSYQIQKVDSSIRKVYHDRHSFETTIPSKPVIPVISDERKSIKSSVEGSQPNEIEKPVKTKNVEETSSKPSPSEFSLKLSLKTSLKTSLKSPPNEQPRSVTTLFD